MHQLVALAPFQAALAAGFLLIIGCWQIGLPEDKIVFLDVGQGDAILLQSGTQQILIDGGPDATVLARLGEELPWFDRNIEILIATHPDKDHVAGLVHVLERYKVELVILPAVPHESQLQAVWLDKIEQAVKTGQTDFRFANAGQLLRFNNLTLNVLHPKLGENFGRKTNNASVSVRGDYCAAVPDTARSTCLSFLLTGDAEEAVERQLTKTFGPQLEADILKAGHHGSKTSTSPEFLATVSPQAVIVSVGRNNQYNHPHPDVLARLTSYHLWRTDKTGSIRFVHNDRQWLVSKKP